MRNINFSRVKKIVIVGTSCCGKTTLGKKLSKLLDFPRKDLDDVFWLPNWTKRSEIEAENIIKTFINKHSEWVISGNYSSVSEKHIWPKADFIIWLDYDFFMILKRAFKRSYINITKKISICQGNYETWRVFFSKHSIIWWILKSYRRRKKNYNNLFLKKGNSDCIRIKHQSQLDEFLNCIKHQRKPFL